MKDLCNVPNTEAGKAQVCESVPGWYCIWSAVRQVPSAERQARDYALWVCLHTVPPPGCVTIGFVCFVLVFAGRPLQPGVNHGWPQYLATLPSCLSGPRARLSPLSCRDLCLYDCVTLCDVCVTRTAGFAGRQTKAFRRIAGLQGVTRAIARTSDRRSGVDGRRPNAGAAGDLEPLVGCRDGSRGLRSRDPAWRRVRCHLCL